MLSALDELIEDDPGDRAVRHSVSRVPGSDVNVLIGAGILADVGEIIDGLDYLARPPVVDALDHWKPLARPFLEAAERLLVIVGIGLAGFVVLAADDEDLVVRFLTRRILGLVDPDVVIRIGRIPVESARNGIFRNARADDVRSIRGLLGVDDQPVIDGCICADDDVVGVDHVPFAGRDPGGDAVHDFFGVDAGIDLSAVAENRAGQTLEVLERMKRRLPWKPQGDSRVPEIEWSALDDFGVREAGAVCRLELALELLSLGLAAEEQVAVHALEITIDVLHRSDRLDPVDGGHVTVGRHPRALASVELLDVVVAVVESRGQMGGGAAGLAAADRAVVDERNGAPCPREKVGSRHSGDPRPDHAYIDPQILCKRLELRNFGSIHPDGGRVT